jgi:hypothetical protein
MDDLAKNGIVETGIDEKWMPEWVEYGIQKFERSLLMHARFDAWLEKHPPEETHES